MFPLRKLQPVSLSDIDFEDRSYCLIPWEETPGKDLLASIKQFGILHPPVLIQKKNKLYCIITGRRRLAATKQHDSGSAISCHILQFDTEEKDSYLLLFEEKISRSILSITEQIFFFDKFLRVASKEESISLLEKCGHKPQEHILKNLLKFKSLDISVLKGMHLGKIHKKNAGKLLKLPQADQQFLVQIISDLHLGGSKQQKVIDLCIELVKRQKMGLEKTLDEFPLFEGKKQPDNMPQHGATLLKWLQQECFPRSSDAEKTFQQRVARLQLPPSMQVSHTPAFENEEIILSLHLRNWDALDRMLKDIRTIIPDE